MPGELTIGAFSRATALTPKALRLYDELGLLRPLRTDPFTGYRYYAPEQVPQARLVAWLRRIGMPLAAIREVVPLESTQAAAEIAAYWARQEHAHAARRDLADVLLRTLRNEETTVRTTPLTIRYAAMTDTGLVRDSNQDTAHATPVLLAVADGFGPDGGQASARAVAALRDAPPSTQPTTEPEADSGTETDAAPGQVLGLLADAVASARSRLRDLPGSGTTLTALLRPGGGDQLALVHIGDTRAYLLRDGRLSRLTHDHSLVQSLVDEGTLTEAEAVTHPQRGVLLRALSADAPADSATGAVELSLHDIRPGDRYLLASDGLTAVADEPAITAALAASHPDADPDRAARDLIALARTLGAPDNIACAVADVLPAPAPASAD